MQWSDDGIVLGARRHGESSAVLELMTRAHGRHLGLVHGGRSRRQQAVLQPGNTVHAVWRARIDEQLGTYTVEAGETRASRLIASPLALHGLGALAALLRLLPERDPHPRLFEAASVLLDHLDDPHVAPAVYVRFELAVLADLGFGLDLASCAATGATEDLVYVSPRSGRAVSAVAGSAYKDRLLALPTFLRANRDREAPSREEVEAGLTLTEFFLRRYVFEPRVLNVPDERARFAALCLKAAEA